jgi:hypothetical protein
LTPQLSSKDSEAPNLAEGESQGLLPSMRAVGEYVSSLRR